MRAITAAPLPPRDIPAPPGDIPGPPRDIPGPPRVAHPRSGSTRPPCPGIQALHPVMPLPRMGTGLRQPPLPPRPPPEPLRRRTAAPGPVLATPTGNATPETDAAARAVATVAAMSSGYLRCDVCGADRARLFLRSDRLDGPLVRCRHCGHLYVGRRGHDFTFSGSDPERTRALAGQVAGLGIVDVAVEEGEAAHLREAAQRERLDRVLAHVESGRLLDVGAALGTFLAVARDHFDARGVEPDPATAAQARARGLSVETGTLSGVARPPQGYDVLTMYHLIEHLDSPRAGLIQARALLAPRGLLVIETPTVDSAFFALAPARWRQLIPDHYHFFSRASLVRLLRDTGFVPLSHVKVGRRVSLRFAADRWRRAGLPAAGPLARAVALSGRGETSLRIVPGDIMEITARAG